MRQPGNRGLDVLPGAQVFSHAVFKDNGKFAGAGFEHVEAVAGNIDASLNGILGQGNGGKQAEVYRQDQR